MTLEEFTATLEGKTPPPVSPALVALWHDGKGDWKRAHEVAQDVDDESGAWVHAYLHRKEGDEGNAGYWYHRAGRKFPSVSLEEEWSQMLDAMLG